MPIVQATQSTTRAVVASACRPDVFIDNQRCYNLYYISQHLDVESIPSLYEGVDRRGHRGDE